MKRTTMIALVVTMGLVALPLQADSTTVDSSGWKVYSVALSTGETSLSSGLTAGIGLGKDEDFLSITMSNTLGEIVYLRQLTNSVTGGFSGGIYGNIPWFGPILTLQPTKNVSTLHWFGLATGEYVDPKLQVNFFFSYHTVEISTWRFSSGYILQHFLNSKPTHYASFKYTNPLVTNKTGSISLVGGLLYNVEQEKLLLSVACRLTR